MIDRAIRIAQGLFSAMSLFNSSAAVDVVRVLSDGGQVFSSARIMRATINDDSDLFSHPLENGNKITDFKIDLPIAIQLVVILPTLDFDSTYKNLKKAKAEGTEFIIQTRADSYQHMVIKSLPHEESPEYGDCLAITISFREVQWFVPVVETLPRREVAPQPKSAKTQGKTGVKPNADTVKSGQKNGKAVTGAPKESVLKSVSKWIGGS